MYFLDTSAIIDLIYGTVRGEKIKNFIHGKPISTSAFTIYELLMGLKKDEVKKIRSFLKAITVFNFDTKSAIKSAEIERSLKKRGGLINKVDIFIAGICLGHNFNLVTCDQDFIKIKTLKVKIF